MTSSNHCLWLPRFLVSLSVSHQQEQLPHPFHMPQFHLTVLAEGEWSLVPLGKEGWISWFHLHWNPLPPPHPVTAKQGSITQLFTRCWQGYVNQSISPLYKRNPKWVDLGMLGGVPSPLYVLAVSFGYLVSAQEAGSKGWVSILLPSATRSQRTTSWDGRSELREEWWYIWAGNWHLHGRYTCTCPADLLKHELLS